jgi:hypothetical protein
MQIASFLLGDGSRAGDQRPVLAAARGILRTATGGNQQGAVAVMRLLRRLVIVPLLAVTTVILMLLPVVGEAKRSSTLSVPYVSRLTWASARAARSRLSQHVSWIARARLISSTGLNAMRPGWCGRPGYQPAATTAIYASGE